MKKIIIIILIRFLLGNCVFSQTIIQHGTKIKETAINNAILAFSNNCSLFKRDSVFSVRAIDTVCQLTTLQNTKGNIYEWVCDSITPNIMSVSIVGQTDKIWYYSNDTIGSKGKIPSRYAIIKGKLFYWRDDSYSLTEETLSVFKKYDALTEMLPIGTLPEFTVDDGKKAAHYYFCKNDLSKNKRVISNIYKPPKLKCNKW
jgi:hypothetical protein